MTDEHIRHSERREGWAVPIDRIEAFAQGAAMEVEPDQIERELAALWRQTAERAQKTGTRLQVTRACLWNFVVQAPVGGDFERLKGLLDDVSTVVPTRLLVLRESPAGGVFGGDDTPLRAFVESNSRSGAGGLREMVSEEITLEASPTEGARLPGLCHALLLPDLPTAVLLPDPLAAPPWLWDLCAESDRVIVDLGAVAPQDLPVLAQRLDELRRRAPLVDVADMLWRRLSPWRRLVATLFDPAEARPALLSLDQVEIGCEPGAAPAGLLMAGWLMSRLGWRRDPDAPAAGVGGGYELLDEQGRRLPLRLVEGPACCGPDQSAPAGVLHVTLRSGDQAFRAAVCGQTRHCVAVEGVAAPKWLQPVHGRADAELLVALLNTAGRDPLVYEALCAARSLVSGGAAPVF